jgi:hypothetical protein
MSALTSQQINLSYQGLIKLEDSTTGITSTFQNLQDGLGGNTGLKISTNGIAGANSYNFYKPSEGQYYGTGFSSSAVSPANNGNYLIILPFWDNGVSSYSAFTVTCLTADPTETLEFSIYSARYVDFYGYVPYQKILGEITVTGTTTTGLKEMVLGSNFSLSGTGPGVYFVIQRYNASTANPNLRFGVPVLGGLQTILPLQFQTGFVYNIAGTAAISPIINNGTSTVTTLISTNATFPSTWTSTELATITGTLSANPQAGFLFHTVR